MQRLAINALMRNSELVSRQGNEKKKNINRSNKK